MDQNVIVACLVKINSCFKYNFFKTIALLLAIIFAAPVYAQKLPAPPPPALKRCGTMEAIQHDIQHDPALKARILQGETDYQNSLKSKMKPGAGNTLPMPLGLVNPIIIPVVVHIVLRNPWQITDDAVQHFIDRLNTDFSGLNPDSANAEEFYPVRGHSLLRFVLARRDINGNFTILIHSVQFIFPGFCIF